MASDPVADFHAQLDALRAAHVTTGPRRKRMFWRAVWWIDDRWVALNRWGR